MPSKEELEAKDLVNNKKCVAFIGAGLSIPPSVTWKVLVDKIAKRCAITPNPKEAVEAIIDRCISADLSGCNEVLRQELPRYLAATRTAIGYLLRLPFTALLTTNFDPWIWVQSRQTEFKRHTIYPDLPLHIGLEGGIYYLHGQFDSENSSSSIENLVFGSNSFSDAYSKSLLPGFLLNVFVYKNILFLGFNPREPRIAKLLVESLEIQKAIVKSTGGAGNIPKKYALLAKSTRATPAEQAEEQQTIAELKAMGITPILYDHDPAIPDHRGIEIMLHNWIQEGDFKNRSAPFLTGFDF